MQKDIYLQIRIRTYKNSSIKMIILLSVYIHTNINVMKDSEKEKRLPFQMHIVDKSNDNSSQDLLSELHEIVPADKF